MAEAVAEEYRSSLADLNFNSKPHINMLTMIAEDNVQYAALIVETIVNHIKSVPPDLKLPSLYLVDSIMKNIGGKYIAQFSKYMVELFSSVFEKVDEATRSSLYKLRQTWNDILPKTVLYGIDCRVNSIDPAWPITAKVTATSIHVNPKFVSGSTNTAQTLLKESEIKKKQDEMKRFIEEKSEHEKMLKLIEEKKTQLRLLEAKKLQLQHAKLKSMKSALLDQKSQSNSVIHRDPRLKKAVALIASSDSGSIPASVQSVVVVPGTNSKSQVATSKPSSLVPSKNDKSVANQTDKPSRSSGAPNDPRTKTNKSVLEESSKRNMSSNKKRGLSLEESSGQASKNKKPCKNSENGTKMPFHQNNESAHSASDKTSKSKSINQVTANQFPKDTSKLEGEKGRKLDADERRPPPIPLFLGNEDKDYRKLTRPIDQTKLPNEITNPPDSESLFVPILQSVNLPTNETQSDRRETHHVPAEQISVPLNVSVSSASINQTMVHFKDVMNPDLIPSTVARGSPIPLTKSFKLDGKDRVIHFVNKRAFAFMDDKEPHEISFIGPPRNVYIEGLPQPLTLGFDQQSHEFSLDGQRNIIQFGTPSREVYINNQPYEIQFGGPPLIAPLGKNNKFHRIRVEGPAPQVLIGEHPAYELYENFNKMHKPSLPVPIPEAVVTSVDIPLPVQDVDMRVKSKPLQPPRFFESTAAKLQDIDWRQASTTECQPPSVWNVSQGSSVVPTNSITNTTAIVSSFTDVTNERLRNIINDRIPQTAPWTGMQPSEQPSFEPTSFGPLPPPPRVPMALSTIPPPLTLPNLPPVDVRAPGLSNLPSVDVGPLPPPPMFPTSIPTVTHPKMPLLPTPHMLPVVTAPSTGSLPPEQPLETVPSIAAPIDVGSFFEKLVAAGIISKKEPTPAATNEKKDSSKEKPDDKVKEDKEVTIPVIELVPKSLKQFYSGVLTLLYKGSQCATCGMRFKNSQGEQYGRHLDWHFRMNRREKDGAKKAFSRRLFYNLQDWTQFTEIEEAEERAPSFFELQADGISVKKEEAEKIHSVRASECETEKCFVCGEQFQLFWVEEEEEWHLRNAVRHDSEVFHPACYEDFIKASKSPPPAETSIEETDEETVKEETDDVAIKVEKETAEEIKNKISEKETSTEEKMDVDESSVVNAPIEEEPSVRSDGSEIADKLNSNTEVKEELIDTVTVKEEPMDTVQVKEEPMDIIKVKEEPVDSLETSNIPLDNSPSKIIVIMNDDFLSDIVGEGMETNANEPLEPDDRTKEQVTVETKIKTEENLAPTEDTDGAESGKDEFRPPTPDPRFDVQEPVFRGTELSALCTIM